MGTNLVTCDFYDFLRNELYYSDSLVEGRVLHQILEHVVPIAVDCQFVEVGVNLLENRVDILLLAVLVEKLLKQSTSFSCLGQLQDLRQLNI